MGTRFELVLVSGYSGIGKSALVRRFVEELDYREVASVIGKSIPAVRVIQHRALGNLRKLMQA